MSASVFSRLSLSVLLLAVLLLACMLLLLLVVLLRVRLLLGVLLLVAGALLFRGPAIVALHLLLLSTLIVVVMVALEKFLAQFLLALVDVLVESVTVLTNRELLVIVN